MRGSGPRGPRNGGKSADPKKSLGKVLRYVMEKYKAACVIVVIGIIISALGILTMTLFMQTLIDQYIMPLMGQADPDFTPLANRLIKLGVVLAAGIISTYAYNRIMVTVSQGTMKRLRVQLFSHMESLPIKYFDTMHTAISCRFIRMMWIRSDSSSARVFRRRSTPCSLWYRH